MAGKRQLKRWTNAFGELLFPPRCYCCGAVKTAAAEGLCRACMAQVHYVGSPFCRICGGNFTPSRQDNHICGSCLLKRPPFSMARGIVYYEEPVRTLLHNLKYSYDTAAVSPLLKIALGFDFSPFDTCEIFLPVPLHKQRLKKRGFNQALLIARLLFPERRGCIYPEVLCKLRHTQPQAGLDASGRKRNLTGAFKVLSPEIIRKKRICIIDDIFTTGTTVAECAAAIREAGGAEVMVLTFARVRNPG